MDPTPPDPPRVGKVSMFLSSSRRAASIPHIVRKQILGHSLFFQLCEKKNSEVNIFQDGISEVNVFEKKKIVPLTLRFLFSVHYIIWYREVRSQDYRFAWLIG